MRDVGALQSILPFSPDSDTGKTVMVRGMGLKVLSAPLNRFEFVSNFIQGKVCTCVHPQLPVNGMGIILNSDLAGGRVWADGKPPNVVIQLAPVMQLFQCVWKWFLPVLTCVQ